MNYCITKFQKIKTNSEITEYAGHNLRTKIAASRNENIDGNRSTFNRRLINKFGIKTHAELQQKINAHYTDLGIKVKKDNVLGIDFIVTTSPEYWGDWHSLIGTPHFEQKLKAWEQIQIKQAEKEFGKDAIAYAETHLDETTPHIHIFIMPIDQKQQTFKNRHGTTVKEKTILNANKYPPQFWNGLVTRFADANKDIGLVRGTSNANAKARPLKDYKLALAAREKELIAMRNDYVNAISNANTQTKTISTLHKENQALKKENALLKAKNRPDLLSENDYDTIGL